MPAKQAPRCLAPATPVFAVAPAPTGTAPALNTALSLWERVYPRSRHRMASAPPVCAGAPHSQVLHRP